MNNSPQTFERYLALDVHKHYLVAGGVNAQQEIVMPPRRFDFGEWAVWSGKHLRPTDALVLEATTNTWTFYDQIAPRVGRCVVAHPGLVKVIAAARVTPALAGGARETDNRDVLHLARALAANLIPEVWVPPLEVRELRALLSHRRRLVKMRTMTKNRLNSVIHRYNLTPPRGELFTTPKYRAWWLGLKVSPTEKLRIRQDLATLDHLEPEIAEVDDELYRLSMVSPWAEQMPYLMQLPGFGIIVAMTVLAAIGDITRFPSAKKLVGYAGLGASVHASGETYRTGHTLAPAQTAGAVQVSPNKGAKTCAGSRSRRRALRCSITITGSKNTRAWKSDSGRTKPSSRSRANCSSRCGTSCMIVKQIGTRSRKKSRTSFCSGRATWARKNAVV